MTSNRSRTLWIAAALLVLCVTAGSGYARRQQRLTHLSSECVAAFHAKTWRRLEDASREWCRLQTSGQASYWLGIALKEQRQFEAAFQAFQSVPLDGPRGIDAAVERMEIQFHILQKPLEAIVVAQKLLDRDRKLPSPRRHLIYFYAMMLDRPELMHHTALAIEDHVDLPEHYVYLLSMEDLGFRDGDQVTRKWAEANPNSAQLNNGYLARRIRTGRAAMMESPTPEAIERYNTLRTEIVPQLRKLGPEPVALDTLLLLAMDDGDADEAGRLLAQVPDSAANDPTFWRFRGWYAMRTDDLEQAEQAYRQSLELDPLGWQTRAEYANVLRQLGRGTEAAAVQTVASNGQQLVDEIRRLAHTRDVDFALLKRIASYAVKCNSTAIANGIMRRQQSSK